jgi:chorismate mutase
MAHLKEIRIKIDKIDSDLFTLLSKRILLCERLALIKKTSHLKLTDKARELEIISRLQTKMKNRLSHSEVEDFVKTILRLSKRRMKKITKN